MRAVRPSERRRRGDVDGHRGLAVGHGTADIRKRCAITKTAHIGCQWGYGQLVIETDSPIFHLARATGLTVASWQDVIMVNQTGKRFWNELDGSYNFIAAAMAYNGDPNKLNGGGPIWAIFDADAVAREKWNPNRRTSTRSTSRAARR